MTARSTHLRGEAAHLQNRVSDPRLRGATAAPTRFRQIGEAHDAIERAMSELEVAPLRYSWLR